MAKPALTARLIEDRLHRAHTEESWARAIIDQVLRAASERIGNGSTEEVTMDARISVQAVEDSQSVRVCIGTVVLGHLVAGICIDVEE